MADSTPDKRNAIIESLELKSVEELLELWEETERSEMSENLPEVRGWLMKALEIKNPEAYNKYLEVCETDDDIRHCFSM